MTEIKKDTVVKRETSADLLDEANKSANDAEKKLAEAIAKLKDEISKTEANVSQIDLVNAAKKIHAKIAKEQNGKS